MVIKQAVILAGGRGGRLMPLTKDRPKPMVEVNSKPFLEYLVGELKKNGIEEIIMLLGYMPDKIVDYFGNGEKYGLRIKYSITSIDDETGTRIRKVKKLLNEKFLLLYSDNYWPLNLEKICEFYARHNTLASITVYENKDGVTKNNTLVDESGLVKIYDKSRTDSRVNGVEIGFYILDKKVLDIMPEENFSFEANILPKLIEMKQLSGYLTSERYYSITTPDKISVVAKYFSSINLLK